jgi:hypothetical protein
MAYKWGGFDTPESFLKGLREGKKAGDVANTYKLYNDNAVISEESVGIDCSGFVSRCWGLPSPVSTKDLPSICDPVAWDELRLGDIILKKGHVLMFAARNGGYVIGCEAGPFPTWRSRYLRKRKSGMTSSSSPAIGGKPFHTDRWLSHAPHCVRLLFPVKWRRIFPESTDIPNPSCGTCYLSSF